jgi:endogenous inhibitor of DNA gyrase (YacG/DUF329 family)
VPCAHCGELVWRKPSQLAQRAFCSNACRMATRSPRGTWSTT